MYEQVSKVGFRTWTYFQSLSLPFSFSLLFYCTYIVVTNVQLYLSYNQIFPICSLSPPHTPFVSPALASCCGNPVCCLALNTFHKPMSKGGVTHTHTDAHTVIGGLKQMCMQSLPHESSNTSHQVSKKKRFKEEAATKDLLKTNLGNIITSIWSD